MNVMELVIRGGVVATPSENAVIDVGIDSGKVVQLGGMMSGLSLIHI